MRLFKFLFGIKRSAAAGEQHKSLKLAKAAASAVGKGSDDATDGSEWRSFDNSVVRAKGWVRLGATCEVAGTQHRLDAARALVSALSRGESVHASMVRDPDNTHDRSAVKVQYSTRHLENELIGYLPRDQALTISRYPADMPIACEIASVRTNGEQYYVKLVVLVPSKKDRVDRGWET